MNEESKNPDNNMFKTLVLPKHVVQYSIAEAERRGYGEGHEALQCLIHERLQPLLRTNIQETHNLECERPDINHLQSSTKIPKTTRKSNILLVLIKKSYIYYRIIINFFQKTLYFPFFTINIQ